MKTRGIISTYISIPPLGFLPPYSSPAFGEDLRNKAVDILKEKPKHMGVTYPTNFFVLITKQRSIQMLGR